MSCKTFAFLSFGLQLKKRCAQSCRQWVGRTPHADVCRGAMVAEEVKEKDGESQELFSKNVAHPCLGCPCT